MTNGRRCSATTSQSKKQPSKIMSVKPPATDPGEKDATLKTKTLGATQEDPSNKTNKKSEKKSKKSEKKEAEEKKKESEKKEKEEEKKEEGKKSEKKEEKKKEEPKKNKSADFSGPKSLRSKMSKMSSAQPPPDSVDIGPYEKLGPPSHQEMSALAKTQECGENSTASRKYEPPPVDQRPKRPEKLIEQDPHDRHLKVGEKGKNSFKERFQSLEIVKNIEGFD